jgi:hypothetical protein
MALQKNPLPFSSMIAQKKKCAVIIGVNKTGGLPVLSAAVSGAEDFNKWAVSQGFDTYLLIDRESPVTVKMIKDAIAGFVNEKIYEQMIVYFSGHGILKSAVDELWLLSEAPEDSNAAVNVQPSRFLSRRCGIPNVVIISDACRSAPGNTQISQMSGSVIFPNSTISSTRVNVDILYATAPGDPAFEVTADEAANNYCGLYTRELLNGLNGKVPQIIKDYDFNFSGIVGLLNSPKYSIISAYELSEYLFTAVPISAAQINITLNQKPDAEITSRSPSYLSLLETPKIETEFGEVNQMTKYGKWLDGYFGKYFEDFKNGSQMPETGDILCESWKNSAEELNNDREIPKTEEIYIEALENSIEELNVDFQVKKTEDINQEILENDLKELQEDYSSLPKKYDKAAFDSILQAINRSSKDILTGFTIVGIPYVENHYSKNDVQIFSENNAIQIRIRIHLKTYFLDLPEGRLLPLAVLPGFIGTVVLDKDEVITVNYSPSSISLKAVNEVNETNRDVEERRAVIAAKSKGGTFRISENIEELSQTASYLRRYKNLDPSLGLYAAYAYSQAGKFEDVQSIYDYMKREPEPVLFDVAMLNELSAEDPDKLVLENASPFCPMLNQGWSYLTINPEFYDPFLIEISKYRVAGLWTTFTAEGSAKIKEKLKDLQI